MWGWPVFESDAQRARRVARERRERDRRLAACVPWTPAIAFAPELNLRGATWDGMIPTLFDLPAAPCGEPPEASLVAGRAVTSPAGDWLYRRYTLPRGVDLPMWSGLIAGAAQISSMVLDARAIVLKILGESKRVGVVAFVLMLFSTLLVTLVQLGAPLGAA